MIDGATSCPLCVERPGLLLCIEYSDRENNITLHNMTDWMETKHLICPLVILINTIAMDCGTCASYLSLSRHLCHPRQALVDVPHCPPEPRVLRGDTLHNSRHATLKPRMTREC